MCIIITKKKGAKPLPMSVFENCWDNNPNGAGILYHDGICSTLQKGIMKKEDFLERVKNANKEECSFVIHTRIATHGSVKPENTHPFVSKTLGFAHNGTMNIQVENDMTDSETFFLKTIADKNFEWCKKNKFLLNMATKGSRCVIFDMNTGEMIHLNEEDWVEDKDYEGAKFSGRSYLYSKSYLFDDYDDYRDYGYYYNRGYSCGKSSTQKTIQNKEEEVKRQTIKYIHEESYKMFKDSKLKGLHCTQSSGLYIDYAEVCNLLPRMSAQPSCEMAKKMKSQINNYKALYTDTINNFDGDVMFMEAIKLIKTFYGMAYANGWYDITEVDKALQMFIDNARKDRVTKDEEDLLQEIEYEAGLLDDWQYYDEEKEEFDKINSEIGNCDE